MRLIKYHFRRLLFEINRLFELLMTLPNNFAFVIDANYESRYWSSHFSSFEKTNVEFRDADSLQCTHVTDSIFRGHLLMIRLYDERIEII